LYIGYKNVSETITDLQARIAFQEDTINELNRQVASLNREVQDMQKQLRLVYKKLDDLVYLADQGQGQGIDTGDERPPHY